MLLFTGMFNKIPIDIIRHVLEYMRIDETWALLSAYKTKRASLTSMIRSMCNIKNGNRIWMPIRCTRFRNPLFTPSDFVNISHQVRKDYIVVSTVCTHCNKKNVMRFASIHDFIRASSNERVPRYINPNTIFLGYCNPISKTELEIGKEVDVLRTNYIWLSAIIVDKNLTHVKIHYNGLPDRCDEYIEKNSLRLSTAGTKVKHLSSLTFGDYLDFKFKNKWYNGILICVKNGNNFTIYCRLLDKTIVVDYNGNNIVQNKMYTKPHGKDGYYVNHTLTSTKWLKNGELPVYLQFTNNNCKLVSM